MHGNSEMQKINQTSAMPEKTDTVFEKQLVIHFVGAYWEPVILRKHHLLITSIDHG